jgi:hypothetical protein
MGRTISAALLCVLLPCAVCAAPQDGDHHLLSTTDLARKIHALQGPNSDLPTDSRDLKRLVSRMRIGVEQFIVHQIKAYPSISGCELQEQLTTAFGIENNRCNTSLQQEPGAPRVFARPWEPNGAQRLFAVTYEWFGFYGMDGSQTILESYLWERDGTVRLTSSSMPESFNGILSKSEEVNWFPTRTPIGCLSGEALEVVADG